ncbi:hypothetical protein ACS0TY_018069 [Phlomoides rotata]
MQHSFFQYGIVAIVTIAIIAGRSTSRDLRPSEHGLAHQLGASSPAQNDDGKGIRSFFGSTATLPEARNIGNETWWSGNDDGRTRDIRRDHLRVGLLVVAAVCGFSGIVLLVVSGIVLIVRRRKRKTEAHRLSLNSELREVDNK